MNLALSAVFWGVITFSILVVLHEGGHFIAARLFGVKVHEFMLGLPGPALRIHGKKTTYGITAVPLGGYVRIAGMEPGPEEPLLKQALAFVTAAGEVTVMQLADGLDVDAGTADKLLLTLSDWGAIEQADKSGESFRSLHPREAAENPDALIDAARSITYRGLPTWKRITVLSMGVLVNLVSAILVFTIVLSIWGYPQASLKLAGATKGEGAAAAGIRKGDTLVAIDGARLGSWDELVLRIQQHNVGDSVRVDFTRAGKAMSTDVKLQKGAQGNPILGVESSYKHVKPGVWGAMLKSFDFLKQTFIAIGGYFNPHTFERSVSMSRSVIGVSVEVARYVNYGALAYAELIAALSLGLGALNILPIPPLDGGKIAIEVIERVMGRPMSRRISLGIQAAGTMLLLVLIGYLMYADVVRYVVRG